MPKLKTNRAAAKRFKVTKRGKVKYKHANLRHLLTTGKRKKRKRQLRAAGVLRGPDVKKVRRLLPYAGVSGKKG